MKGDAGGAVNSVRLLCMRYENMGDVQENPDYFKKKEIFKKEREFRVDKVGMWW